MKAEHSPFQSENPPQRQENRRCIGVAVTTADSQEMFKFAWNSVTAELQSDQICAVTWHLSTSSHPCNNPKLMTCEVATCTPPTPPHPSSNELQPLPQDAPSLSIFMRSNNISSVTWHTFQLEGQHITATRPP